MDLQSVSKIASNVRFDFSYMSAPEQQEWISFKKIQANRLYKHNQYAQAFAPYIEGLAGSMLLQDLSLQVTLLCNLCSCLTRADSFDEAFSVIGEALRIDSSNSRALERKGFVLHAMGYHEEALESLNLCIKTSSDTAILNQASILAQKIGKKKQSGTADLRPSMILQEINRALDIQ